MANQNGKRGDEMECVFLGGPRHGTIGVIPLRKVAEGRALVLPAEDAETGVPVLHTYNPTRVGCPAADGSEGVVLNVYLYHGEVASQRLLLEGLMLALGAQPGALAHPISAPAR
jgi:hypothetical protein